MKLSVFFLWSAVLLFITSLSSFASGDIPLDNGGIFTPGKLVYDTNNVAVNAHGGGILYHNGIYYWYGEHKIAGEKGNEAHVGVHVYSSKNLTTWNDEGVALKVSDDPSSEIVAGSRIERPKVIYNKKTGKFVMWFHLELRDYRYFSARTGVAISDSPQGPFTFIRSMRPNAGHWPLNVTVEQKNKHWIDETIKASQATWINSKVDSYKYNILGMNFKNGQMARDMTLFVDDDGSAYQIYSSEHNSTLHISKLTDDYLGHKGEYIRVFPNRYMEAPAVFKHDDKYYLIASTTTGWEPNTARSAIADNIMGPWKELGDPMIGESNNGYSKTQTFGGQSTYVLPVQGKKDAYIAMFDKWNPDNAIDGRYIWLPVQFTLNDEFRVPWFDQWSLSYFDKVAVKASEKEEQRKAYVKRKKMLAHQAHDALLEVQKHYPKEVPEF